MTARAATLIALAICIPAGICVLLALLWAFGGTIEMMTGTE